jgi:hypothetical protein
VIAGLFAILVAIVTGVFNLSVVIYKGCTPTPTGTPVVSGTPTRGSAPMSSDSPPPDFPQEVSQTKADRDTQGKPQLLLKCRVEAWPAGYELRIQASDDNNFSQDSILACEKINAQDQGKIIAPIALRREPHTPTVWYRFVIKSLQRSP